VPIVSDERWREILAAAAPYVPSATAGIEVERALAAYVFAIDSRKVKAERAREKQIVDLASKLNAVLYSRRRQVPWPEDDPEQPLRELQAVTSVLWHHQQLFDDLDTLVHERARRSDPARALLLLRLLDIWVDHFDGKLSVTKPTKGRGAPSGPLVRFILAATHGVLKPPPSAHTISDYVDRKQDRKKRGPRQRTAQRRTRGVLLPGK
jgi:hypothetical protein